METSLGKTICGVLLLISSLSVTLTWSFTSVSHLLKCIYSTFSLAALFFLCDEQWLVVLHLLCTSPESIDSLAVLFQNSKYLISLCMGFTSHLFLFLSPFSMYFKFYSVCLKHWTREGWCHNCLQCSKFMCWSVFCGIVIFLVFFSFLNQL